MSVLELHDSAKPVGGEEHRGDSQGEINRRVIKVRFTTNKNRKQWKREKLGRIKEGEALKEQGNKSKNRRDLNVERDTEKRRERVQETANKNEGVGTELC